MVPEEGRGELPKEADITIPLMTPAQRADQLYQRMRFIVPERMVTLRRDVVYRIVNAAANYDVVAVEVVCVHRRIKAFHIKGAKDGLTDTDMGVLDELDDELDKWMSVLSNILVTSWGSYSVPAPDTGSIHGVNRITRP